MYTYFSYKYCKFLLKLSLQIYIPPPTHVICKQLVILCRKYAVCSTGYLRKSAPRVTTQSMFEKEKQSVYVQYKHKE